MRSISEEPDGVALAKPVFRLPEQELDFAEGDICELLASVANRVGGEASTWLESHDVRLDHVAFARAQELVAGAEAELCAGTVIGSPRKVS